MNHSTNDSSFSSVFHPKNVLPFVTPFLAAKQRYERHNENFYEKLEKASSSYSPLAEYEELEQNLLSTPARSLADVAYKVELSRGYLDELGELVGADDELRLLDRALSALKAGKVKTAIAALNAVLTGDYEYPFAYDGAIAALADLRRMEVQS